ncbi:hypothetical protein [Paenibacillus dendritiformis]|uniref:hypothetical protein n=1 Tax=Paenibacillus dendritiformis TaxID=130049 RepID=UPI000DA76EC9|nr:hypothetical protein [Paenibacillus dendritiformis]PZM63463.1 hypothetical protein DOE73_21725 [Paenibacillus dendritiformis]
MEEIRKALCKLQKLQHETQGVSAGNALYEISWFMKHDLEEVIMLLQQVESEMAAVGAATTSHD